MNVKMDTSISTLLDLIDLMPENFSKISDISCQKFIARLMINILKIRNIQNFSVWTEKAIAELSKEIFKKSEFQEFKWPIHIFMHLMAHVDSIPEARVEGLWQFLATIVPGHKDSLMKHLEKVSQLKARDYTDPDGWKKPPGKIGAIRCSFAGALYMEYFSLSLQYGEFNTEDVFQTVSNYYEDKKRGYKLSGGDFDWEESSRIKYFVTRLLKEGENLKIEVKNYGKHLAVKVWLL
jgi:hypothetical protein